MFSDYVITAVILIAFFICMEKINRPSTILYKVAGDIIVSKLSRRPELPIMEVLATCALPNHLYQEASFLLLQLGAILGQSSNKFRPDDKFEELLAVYRTDFTEYYQQIWDKQGYQDSLEVFWDDVDNFLMKYTCVKRLRKAYEAINFQPKDETERIDHYFNMTLCELLNFYAPLVIMPSK